MPRVSITTSLNSSINEIRILSNYNNSSKLLDARYQYMIGEILMLRLFSILDATISEVAFKLACGATYTSGRNPLVLQPCRSILDAYTKMLNHNRTRPMRYLQWTKTTFIRNSIEHVLDIRDHFYINIQNHGNLINEMRIVRNQIAHNSTSTKTEYITLLRTLYGGNPKLTMGAFLTSTNRHAISNIDRYITSTIIILNDISRG